MDYIEYAAQMRAAAPTDDNVMQVSKDLWLYIAKVIEEAGQRIATVPTGLRNDTALRVPCLPGAMVRFKGLESAWKVVCINFYAEGVPTASVTNGKITSTMPLTELAEAETLSESLENRF